MITKRFFVIALVLSFLGVCDQLCAIISFLAVDNRSAKTFIRIGERHNLHCMITDRGAPQEIRDRDAIRNLVTAAANSKRKVCVLIEANPARIAVLMESAKQRVNQGYEPTLLDVLIELSQMHHKKLGSVSFGYFDKLRGVAMNDLFTLWFPLTVTKYFVPYFVTPLIEAIKGQSTISSQNAAFIDKLTKEPTRQNLDAALKAVSNPVKKDYYGIELWKQVCRENGMATYSVQDFYKELENVKSSIRQMLSTLNPSSSEYYILFSYLSRIDTAYCKAQAFYQKYVSAQTMNNKGSSLMGLYDALKKTSFGYMYDQYVAWVEPLMADVADVSIFLEAIAAFQKYDVVISVSGDAHAYASQTVCDSLYLQSIFKDEGVNKDSVTGDFFSIFTDSTFYSYINTMRKYIVA